MRYRVDEPVFTTVQEDVSRLRPVPGSLYITGISVEERSSHTAKWEANCGDVTFARLKTHDRAAATVTIADRTETFRLRSSTEVGRFLDKRYTAVYLDVTGLPHHVWAPLLKGLRTRGEPAFAVYVEPGDYRFSSTPTEATIFDLSESIEGIGPLPGFVSLSDDAANDALFVPLLGFEGARFRFMLEAAQPKRANICPLVGVPGFRPEYPFYTYVGNRLQLEETKAWQNVRFAPANCPFSAYQVFEELSAEHFSRRLRIALIGTKPHALGAILYYLDHPNTTEIVYDYPVRKERRTIGISRVCVYDLSLLPPIRPERADPASYL
jgi:hypothetical protein